MTAVGKLRLVTGQNTGSWLLLLLAAGVLIPTAGVLWFMTRAMENERFAVRQKLGEAYRAHLTLAQERLEEFWNKRGLELDRPVEVASPSAAFAKCVREGLADSAICFDAGGQAIYPRVPALPPTGAEPQDEGWMKAMQLENTEGNFVEAAAQYSAVATLATNAALAARALQSQARCLTRAGRKDRGIQVMMELVSQDRFAQATDAEGRLIIANAELMTLELLGRTNEAQFGPTFERLKDRLLDYDSSPMPASQRRFLMKELQTMVPMTVFREPTPSPLPGGELTPGASNKAPLLGGDAGGFTSRAQLSPEQTVLQGQPALFPTMPAEDLAARYLEARSAADPSPQTSQLQPTPVSNIWVFMSPGRRIAALFESGSALERMQAVIEKQPLPTDVALSLVAPGEGSSPEKPLVSIPAGPSLPGWQLALALKDQTLFETTAKDKAASYLWTGILVIAAMTILALVIASIVRQQVELTRLKNDLVAAVTHELKTPLSSMRLLVDTLLDAEKMEPQTAREYLQLIARENSRLSRLIDNFLAFSRMERNKYAFDFRDTTAREIADQAVSVMQERFDAAHCRFDLEIAPSVPGFAADADALATTLINLLDNALKYTGDDKRIRLRVFASEGSVRFEVTDNGIGISPRETKKIFKRFYQVDQSASRGVGGCGLGLSIVQFIASAHHGSVRVDSQPGRGSVFTISIPTANESSE